MSATEHVSNLSHDASYTHFRNINNPDVSDVELTCTIEDSGDSHETLRTSKLKHCMLKCCEVFVLLVLVLIVWGALSIPSVFFIISRDGESNGTVTPSFLGNCTPVPYDGKTCISSLKSYEGCPNSPTLAIPKSTDQNAAEELLTNLNKFSFLIGLECLMILKPFVCVYFLGGLCIENTRQTVLPSRTQCNTLKNEICSSVWNLVKMSEHRDLLPKCHKLPKNGRDVTSTECSKTMPANITCREDLGFYPDTNTSTCAAQCDKWTPYSELELRITNVVVIISGVVAIIAGVIVLILACVRCKKIFSYPSIFVIYQTIPTMILGSLVLIAFIGQPYLFCRSESSVIDAIKSPTPFCVLTGVCLYYFVMQLLLLWLFHIISIFWGVYWPIWASLQSAARRVVLHIAAVSMALVLPAIPVLIIHYLAPGAGGFTLTRFPPILCAASSLALNFYTFMLPLSILIACGLTLLVLIFWRLFKKQLFHHINQTRQDTNWCTQVRVLTVLCYFVIFGLVVLSTFTTAMINFSSFFDELMNYFRCEEEGVDSSSHDCQDYRQAVADLVNPATTTIALVVLGFYPAVNLVYVIHCRELKENCSCCQTTREVEYTYRDRPYSAVASNVSSSTKGVQLDTHSLL